RPEEDGFGRERVPADRGLLIEQSGLQVEGLRHRRLDPLRHLVGDLYGALDEDPADDRTDDGEHCEERERQLEPALHGQPRGDALDTRFGNRRIPHRCTVAPTSAERTKPITSTPASRPVPDSRLRATNPDGGAVPDLSVCEHTYGRAVC